ERERLAEVAAVGDGGGERQVVVEEAEARLEADRVAADVAAEERGRDRDAIVRLLRAVLAPDHRIELAGEEAERDRLGGRAVLEVAELEVDVVAGEGAVRIRDVAAARHDVEGRRQRER